MSTNFQIGFVTNKNSSKVLRPPGGGSSDIFAADSASTPRSIKNHMKSNIFAAPSPVRGGTTEFTVRQGLHRYFYMDNHARRPQVDSHNRLFGDNSVSVTPAKNRQNSNIPIGGDAPDSSLKHSNGNGHTNSSREHININGNGSEKSFDYNENYRHSTGKLASPSSKYPTGIDVNLCKASNYLNPTYNSKINLCINDDYIDYNCNNRSPSYKRESKFFDENMNYNTSATPLINAQELKIRINGSTTDGSSLNGEISKPSGENAPPNVVNKNRIPPGGFSSGLW